jgi:HEAT repeat protein
LLRDTPNEAAVRVLVEALDSPHEPVRDAALTAILSRRSAVGLREVVRRLHTLTERSRDAIFAHRGRISQALRPAVLTADPQLCGNACVAIAWAGEYDLVPTLLSALEVPENPNGDLIAKTLLDLVRDLYDALASGQRVIHGQDPKSLRRSLLHSLELSVVRFGCHRRLEVLKAFLMLVDRDNATLKRVLLDTRHAAFVATVDFLSKGSDRGIIGLLLSFLDDPQAPSAALSVIGRRRDLTFLGYLLRKLGDESSAVVTQNLRSIKSLAWAGDDNRVLDDLDDALQPAAMKMVMASGLPRVEAIKVIRHMLYRGTVAGRRAAAEALAHFRGSEAGELTLKALADEDPYVQAAAVGQIRNRGIPGVLPRLLKMIDSPHAVVQKAIQENLTEFSFQRFLAAYDMLDEDVRQSTGQLVKRIDAQAIPLLEAEMCSAARSRRLRAIHVAQSLDAVAELEQTIIRLIDDEDHMVRAASATALGDVGSEASRQALERARRDRSKPVQEAAERSLASQVELLAAHP